MFDCLSLFYSMLGCFLGCLVSACFIQLPMSAGEDAITKRQERLKAWINRIARHPVLSADRGALEHFLICSTSDKNVRTHTPGLL